MGKVQMTFEDLVTLAERAPALRSYEERIRWLCGTLKDGDPYEVMSMLVSARDRLAARDQPTSPEDEIERARRDG